MIAIEKREVHASDDPARGNFAGILYDIPSHIFIPKLRDYLGSLVIFLLILASLSCISVSTESWGSSTPCFFRRSSRSSRSSSSSFLSPHFLIQGRNRLTSIGLLIVKMEPPPGTLSGARDYSRRFAETIADLTPSFVSRVAFAGTDLLIVGYPRKGYLKSRPRRNEAKPGATQCYTQHNQRLLALEP